MGMFDRKKKKADAKDEAVASYEQKLSFETKKVRAYRTADEMVKAAHELMQKAKELRAELAELEAAK